MNNLLSTVRAGGCYLPEVLFNVRVNGAIVAGGVTREVADTYLGKRLGFVEVYMTDKPPPDERPRLRLATLPKAHDFRRGPISVGPAERAKSLARVHADRSILVEYDAPAESVAEGMAAMA